MCLNLMFTALAARPAPALKVLPLRCVLVMSVHCCAILSAPSECPFPSWCIHWASLKYHKVAKNSVAPMAAPLHLNSVKIVHNLIAQSLSVQRANVQIVRPFLIAQPFLIESRILKNHISKSQRMLKRHHKRRVKNLPKKPLSAPIGHHCKVSQPSCIKSPSRVNHRLSVRISHGSRRTVSIASLKTSAAQAVANSNHAVIVQRVIVRSLVALQQKVAAKLVHSTASARANHLAISLLARSHSAASHAMIEAISLLSIVTTSLALKAANAVILHHVVMQNHSTATMPPAKIVHQAIARIKNVANAQLTLAISHVEILVTSLAETSAINHAVILLAASHAANSPALANQAGSANQQAALSSAKNAPKVKPSHISNIKAREMIAGFSLWVIVA